jgi:hypothetical protein
MTMKSKKAKRPDVEFDDDTDDSDDDALEIFRYNISKRFLLQCCRYELAVLCRTGKGTGNV